MNGRYNKTLMFGTLITGMFLANIGSVSAAGIDIQSEQQSVDECCTVASSLNVAKASLSIKSNVAEMSLSYIPAVKMDSIVVSARFQKYSSGTWKRVKIWDDVKSSGNICSVTKSYKVTSSGKYRAKFVVTTKNGKNQKTETLYSNVVNH